MNTLKKECPATKLLTQSTKKINTFIQKLTANPH